MVGELVVEPFLEPPAALVVCNEKSSDDASQLLDMGITFILFVKI